MSKRKSRFDPIALTTGRFKATVLRMFRLRHGVQTQAEIARRIGESPKTLSRQLSHPATALTPKLQDNLLEQFPLLADKKRILDALHQERVLQLPRVAADATFQEVQRQVIAFEESGDVAFAERLCRDFLRRSQNPEETATTLKRMFFVQLRQVMVSQSIGTVRELRALAEERGDLVTAADTFTLEAIPLRVFASAGPDAALTAHQSALSTLESCAAKDGPEAARHAHAMGHHVCQFANTVAILHDRGQLPKADLEWHCSQVRSVIYGNTREVSRIIANAVLARLLIAMGRFTEARAAIAEGRRLRGRTPVTSKDSFRLVKLELYVAQGDHRQAVRLGQPLATHCLSRGDRHLFFYMQEALMKARAMSPDP